MILPVYLEFAEFSERNFGGIPLEGGVRSTKKIPHTQEYAGFFFVILRITS